jgi:hypothetical protein
MPSSYRKKAGGGPGKVVLDGVPFAIKMTLLVSAIALQLAIHKIAGMYDGCAAGGSGANA